ncbi:haloacid dehalogenase [Paenibacillus sp. J31TS4]|uniref:HAD-IIA family hydrolase n=1 Tax=Paenibacillus sp. J31TS4 TaxID=2807195 RepID=UPI001B085F36|nr:HAD-IIA family hydrolase [Paenibacillus sp. J31TS4]GIP41279.1 haloacid dehalogenase [Paenibacillus sp. J31TS4]
MTGFILDLDGTMYAGNSPIEGADAFVGRLRSDGLPFLFATNNSSRRPEEVAAHLAHAARTEARVEEVLTSAQAAARYVAERHPGARVYAIGEAGLAQALAEAGLTLTDDAPDFVVQGIDRHFDYAKLAAAVRHIRGGAGFVVTNPDHLLPGDGGLNPGAGSIAAAIRIASEAEPVVIGKPSPILLGYALERLGLSPQDAWVVGDNLWTDIKGGREAGCRTALVLTGVASPETVEEQIHRSGVRPDLVCRDLPELYERLLSDGLLR